MATNKLKSYYTRNEVEELPPISVTAAVALLVLYTLLYVIPFYLSPTTRPSATLSRDNPSVIRARIRSVTWTCALCTLCTTLLLTHLPAHSSPLSTLHLMGYYPPALLPTLRAVLLTAVLFLGPLFEAAIVEGSWRAWLRLRGLHALWTDLPTFRTLVAGPLTEEMLFRSAALPLFLLSPASLWTTFLIPPLVFGLAHFHHIYEYRLLNPAAPLLLAVLRSVVQLLYTSLFGSFATFVYLRTGSLLAVVLCHAFCNFMGLPRFWGRLEGGGAETIIGPDVGADQDGRDEGQVLFRAPKELGVSWTVAYYTLLVTGAVGFYKYFWILTESGNALAEF